MTKAKFGFVVKRKSDTEAVVMFPSGIKVGKNIDADKLLIALLKHSHQAEVQGQCMLNEGGSGCGLVKSCCGK
jgi:hypothetical protein